MGQCYFWLKKTAVYRVIWFQTFINTSKLNPVVAFPRFPRSVAILRRSSVKTDVAAGSKMAPGGTNGRWCRGVNVDGRTTGRRKSNRYKHTPRLFCVRDTGPNCLLSRNVFIVTAPVYLTVPNIRRGLSERTDRMIMDPLGLKRTSRVLQSGHVDLRTEAGSRWIRTQPEL